MLENSDDEESPKLPNLIKIYIEDLNKDIEQSAH